MATESKTFAGTSGSTSIWNASATKAGTYTIETSGKYVDRNIQITIPAGGFNLTGSLSSTNISFDTYENTTSKIDASVEIDINGTAGFVTSNDLAKINNDQYVKQITIPSGGILGETNINTSGVMPGVTMERNTQMSFFDGVNTWLWSVDSSNNVIVS